MEEAQVISRFQRTVLKIDGRLFRVAKGTPQVILKLADDADQLAREADRATEEFAGHGFPLPGSGKE